MALRFKFKTRTEFGRAIETEVAKGTEAVVSAAVGALEDAAKQAVTQGRANIRAAGRFTGHWVTGLRSRVYKNRGLDAAALIYHRTAVAGVFEEGGQIKGNPLMWLPLSNVQREALAARRARRRLVSVKRPGKRPLLIGEVSGKRVPLFVGVDVVNIRKRFAIAAIVRRAADQLANFYSNRFRAP